MVGDRAPEKRGSKVEEEKGEGKAVSCGVKNDEV
jgi:hypothetical protein